MNRLAPLVLPMLLLALVSGCEPQQQEEEPSETMMAAAAVVEMPVSTASEAALADFEQAMHVWDVGRWQDAHDLFVSATEKDPGFVRAYVHAANTAGSWEAFKKFHEKAKENIASANEGERLLVEWNETVFSNDLERRRMIATQLVEMYPSNPRAIVWLGDVQAGLNMHAEARATYEKALALDPDFIPAHTSIGFSYLNSEPKDYSKAETHIRKTVELEPNEPVLWVNLGDVQRGSNRLLEARESYRKATELDPTNDLAWSKSGHTNTFLGNFDEARSDFDQAVATAEEQQKIGWAQFKAYVDIYAGDPAVAIDELKALYETVETAGIPEDQILGTKTGVLNDVATIALHHGMLDIAEEAVNLRNELWLQNAENVGSEELKRRAEANVALWQGVLAARKGDFATARTKADAHAALRESESNPRKMEGYHNLMGLIELGEGNYAGAIEHYRQANPNSMYVKYHLALAEQSAGNTEEADRLFKEVAEYNFNSAAVACVKNDAMERVSETVM